jgi:hypothetical protein
VWVLRTPQRSWKQRAAPGLPCGSPSLAAAARARCRCSRPARTAGACGAQRAHAAGHYPSSEFFRSRGRALKRFTCAGFSDAVVQHVLVHVRVLEGVQACACSRAFVHSPAHLVEASDTCILRAPPGALTATETCAVCRGGAHPAFGWKCDGCSFVLHQSCVFKLWASRPRHNKAAACPQCRCPLARPVETELAQP